MVNHTFIINKKGDMNFWLVTLVIALIFMVIVFFVMNSVFQKWGETTGGVQGQIDEKTKEEGGLKNIFEGITGSDKESTSESTTSDTKE